MFCVSSLSPPRRSTELPVPSGQLAVPVTATALAQDRCHLCWGTRHRAAVGPYQGGNHFVCPSSVLWGAGSLPWHRMGCWWCPSYLGKPGGAHGVRGQGVGGYEGCACELLGGFCFALIVSLVYIYDLELQTFILLGFPLFLAFLVAAGGPGLTLAPHQAFLDLLGVPHHPRAKQPHCSHPGPPEPRPFPPETSAKPGALWCHGHGSSSPPCP